ncbi:unnamed protein product [Danaus chrysippus]|uniref:(African queen) hypothetical protein n=1 Tax=Danaus chrysippus TaxID=151541 RepID=A0A8J2QVC4_9NEOP|nr:unnamed protein product [Danaus chrysippus]
MSEEIETYCRLCAEPTPKTQLIEPEEDVAITSKILAKLTWINVDVSVSNGLPNTICFSCFDQLERTWAFLNNVRCAQDKLNTIFKKESVEKVIEIDSKNNLNCQNVAGKPLDKDWEAVEGFKSEIKVENAEILQVIPITDIKAEADSEEDFKLRIDYDSLDLSSTDSEAPLVVTKKNKKLKRKVRESKKDVNEISVDSIVSSWDDQGCRCAECDAQCKSILSLQLHSIQIHNSCCVFKCIDCSKVARGYRSFIRHIRTHNRDLRHCCEYCNEIFSSISKLKLHKVKEHRFVFKTKCTSCGASFDTVEQLNEHKALFVKDAKKIKISETIKEESTEMKCDHCEKVFKTRANLLQHKLLHTERIRNFACHICGKMFFTKGTLVTHMVTHEDTKPFKCDHCPLTFRAKGNLISHISLHSGLKPFICEQCGKSFRVKRHLMSHSIVHTDLRPFVCEYCHKAFRFKTRLNLHLRQHTGVKPYKCVYCQRDFTNGSNYKKHMKRRHGIDTSSRIMFNNSNPVKVGSFNLKANS